MRISGNFERASDSAETANYVRIILAMTIVSKNAPEYGIYDITPERPIEYETLKLECAVNLGLISDLTETPVPELQQLNLRCCGVRRPEGYDLHVPKGMAGGRTDGTGCGASGEPGYGTRA